MTSKRELETMIAQFKVSDLQLLLNFAGQNSKGRKNDLQRKALSLVRQNISLPLEMKIRTMYRQMLNEAQKQNEYYYRMNPNTNYDKFGHYYTNTNPYTTQPAAGMSYDPYNSKNYYQNQNGGNPYYDECMRKNSSLYTPINCNQMPSYESSSPSPLFDYMSYLEAGVQIPEAKNLKEAKFKKLTFYKYNQTIVPLMPMKPQHKLGDVFDYTHSFTVGEQVRNLFTWPKKDEKDNRFQLQLRICLLDQDTLSNLSDISDSLPLALSVKVNEKSCALPPAIPSTNKQGMLLKRMNAPINISCQSLRKSPLNTLNVNWSVECNKLYGFTVHAVKKYTSDELIEKLKATKQRDSKVTRKYIHDQLDEDDDIAATSLKVSLVCPLGKILMSLPARATTCNHIQCFDATLYMKMNEVKSVWQCPVCNSSCFYEDLFIDGYFIDILKSGKFSSNVNEVQINNDGSWEPVIVKKRKNSDTDSENKSKKRICDREREKCVDIPKGNANSTEESRKENDSPLSTVNDTSKVPACSAPASFGGLENSSVLDPYFLPADRLLMNNNVLDLADSASVGVSSPDRLNLEDMNNIDESFNTIENSDSAKTNVIVVDLLSDSESEECSSPLNLKKTEPNDLLNVLVNSYQPVPPVYDIDDSDEHS